METKKRPVLLQAMLVSLPLGLVTWLIAFSSNANLLPIFLPFGLAIGLVGLLVSKRQAKTIDASLRNDRNRLSMSSFLISGVVFLVCFAMLNANGDTNLDSLGFLFAGIIMLPFYLGTASLLAIALLPAKR